MKPTPGILNIEDVRRLHSEGHSVLQIARILRRRNDLIVSAMRQLGIDRSAGIPSKAWLIEHYVQRQETVDEIAEHWNRNEATIRSHLRRYSIPQRYRSRGAVRNASLADADWLEARYVTELRSLQNVADLAHCKVSSVVCALARHGISRRLRPKTRYQSRFRYFTGKTRRLVLERDGYRCRWPSCDATTHLEINHIVPLRDGGMTTVSNGITLCRMHHRAIASREHLYVQLFSELIASGPLT